MGSTKFLTDAILFGPFRYLRGDRCPSWEAPRTRDKTAFFSHAGIGVDDDLRCWDCAERLAVPDISSLLCSWRKEMNVPSERLPADILAAHYDLLLDLHSQHVPAKPFKWYSTRLERAGPIVVGTLQSMLVELDDWKSALSSADWALLEEEWSHNHYNDDCVKKIDLAVVRSASKGSMASTDSGIAMSLSDDPRGIFAQARNMCNVTKTWISVFLAAHEMTVLLATPSVRRDLSVSTKRRYWKAIGNMAPAILEKLEQQRTLGLAFKRGYLRDCQHTYRPGLLMYM